MFNAQYTNGVIREAVKRKGIRMRELAERFDVCKMMLGKALRHNCPTQKSNSQ